MKKLIITILFFVLLFNISYSQQGYVMTDTSITYGENIKIVYENNEIVACEIVYRKMSKIFYPKDITEFKTAEGRVFVSTQISKDGSVKNIFLEKYIYSQDTLYFMNSNNQNYFFYKENDEYFEITENKNDTINTFYKDYFLKKNADCLFSVEYIDCMKFSKMGIKRAYKKFEVCKNYHIPEIYYGFYFGTSIKNLVLKDEIMDRYFNKKKILFLVGVSFRKPINYSRFYWGVDMFFEKNSFYLKFTDENKQNYKHEIIDFYSINIPLNLRYETKNTASKIYIKVGGNIKYNFLLDCIEFNYSVNGNNIYIDGYKNSNYSINKMFFEKNFGAGFRKPMINNHYISIELNYFKDLFQPNLDIRTFQIKLLLEF